MKRHQIVGIIAGICAVGLALRHSFQGNVLDGLITFAMLSVVAISTFFKDKLPPQMSRRILPSWVYVVLFLLLFGMLVFTYFR